MRQSLLLLVIVLPILAGAQVIGPGGSNENPIPLPDNLLLGTTFYTNFASGFTITSANAHAEEFSLSTNANVQTINFMLGGVYQDIGGGSAQPAGLDVPFVLELTNGLGPDASVLLRDDLTFQGSADSILAQEFDVHTPGLHLSSGSYYLVLASLDSNPLLTLTWVPAVGSIPSSPYGSIGLPYYAPNLDVSNPEQSNFSAYNGQTLGFQLTGQPIGAVPEPSAIILLSAGALGVFGLMRRKLLG